MNPKVDTYLIDGCGRCEYYKTPKCKVHDWEAELRELRRIVLDCGLKEDYKWSQPCYTLNTKNVLILTALRDYAALAFFKGSLLKDTHSLLIAPGERSQAARQLRFTDVRTIQEKEAVIKTYIHQAIEVEKAGLQVEFKKSPEPLPDELIRRFEKDPELKTAFNALTPGKQRGYLIHFSQPKQSTTRVSRIEKCIPKILKGEGMHDKYKSRKR